MKKTLLLIPLLVLCAGGESKPAETKPERVVETPLLDTRIGDAILRANAAEVMEAAIYERIDSIRYATDKKF